MQHPTAKNSVVSLSFVLATIVASFLITSIAKASTNQELTHGRPTPMLPKIVHPAYMNDVFTAGLLPQIHQTLFDIDLNGYPKPKLVKNYVVINKGLTWSIELKTASFDDGTPLNSTHVKKSLEFSIMEKAVNYEGFQTIKGFDEFISNKTPDITGIEIVDDSKILFHLNVNDPELAHKLTDIRFSILKDAKSPALGLGEFRLAKITDDSIELVLKTRIPNSPTHLYYKKMTKPQAIKAFQSNTAHDLFNYQLNKKEISSLSENANIVPVTFPKTYVYLINPAKNPNQEIRKSLYIKSDPKAVIKNCFRGEEIATSFVPPGFMGFKKNSLKVPPTKALSLPQQMVIDIIDGVGEEVCIKEALTQLYGKNAAVSIVQIDKALNRWEKGISDVMFAYIEAESTITYFGSFNNKTKFGFGDPKNSTFNTIFTAFENASDPTQKLLFSQRLSENIISRFTVRPIFHGRSYLIYSKRYKNFQDTYLSAALLPLTLFKLEPQK